MLFLSSMRSYADRLRKNKINVQVGHTKKNISKATILVISSAIKKNNPELLEAKKKKYQFIKEETC